MEIINLGGLVCLNEFDYLKTESNGGYFMDVERKTYPTAHVFTWPWNTFVTNKAIKNFWQNNCVDKKCAARILDSWSGPYLDPFSRVIFSRVWAYKKKNNFTYGFIML